MIITNPSHQKKCTHTQTHTQTYTKTHMHGVYSALLQSIVRARSGCQFESTSLPPSRVPSTTLPCPLLLYRGSPYTMSPYRVPSIYTDLPFLLYCTANVSNIVHMIVSDGAHQLQQESNGLITILCLRHLQLDWFGRGYYAPLIEDWWSFGVLESVLWSLKSWV